MFTYVRMSLREEGCLCLDLMDHTFITGSAMKSRAKYLLCGRSEAE